MKSDQELRYDCLVMALDNDKGSVIEPDREARIIARAKRFFTFVKGEADPEPSTIISAAAA